MRFVTAEEARSWSDSNFWGSKKPSFDFERQRVSIKGLDSGHKTEIARRLAYNLLSRNDQQCMVTLTERSRSPLSECLPLAERFRMALGASESIATSPGHSFDEGEADLLFALLAIVLYFSWGCECVSSDSGWSIRISSDDSLEVVTAEPGSSDEVLAVLCDTGLANLESGSDSLHEGNN